MSNFVKTTNNTKMLVTVYNKFCEIDFNKPNRNKMDIEFNPFKSMGIITENCILNNLWKDLENGKTY